MRNLGLLLIVALAWSVAAGDEKKPPAKAVASAPATTQPAPNKAEARIAALERELADRARRLKVAEAAGVAAMKDVQKLKRQLADAQKLKRQLTDVQKRLSASESLAKKHRDEAIKSVRGEAQQKKQVATVSRKLKGAEGQVKSLQAQQKNLQEQIKQWKARAQTALKKIASIEAARRKAPAWLNKDNWRKLRVGQQTKEVKAILGDPGKIFSSMIGKTLRVVWYYPSVFGGNVEFEGGKVRAWKEP